MPEGEQVSRALLNQDGGRTYAIDGDAGFGVAPFEVSAVKREVRTVADALKRDFGWDYAQHDELMHRIPEMIPERRAIEFGRSLNKVWRSGLIPHANTDLVISSISTESSNKHISETNPNGHHGKRLYCTALVEHTVTYRVNLRDVSRAPQRETFLVKVNGDNLTVADVLSTIAFDVWTSSERASRMLRHGNCISSVFSSRNNILLSEKFGFRFSGIGVVNDNNHKQISYHASCLNSQAREHLVHIFSFDYRRGELAPSIVKWFSTVGKNYVRKRMSEGNSFGISQFIFGIAKNSLDRCMDYLTRADISGIRQLQKISVPDMADRHDSWVKARNKQLAKEKKERVKRLVKNIANNDHENVCHWFPDGSRVVKLVTHDDFMMEGQIMEHCVESYFGDYDDAEGFDGIYSLRGHDGMPTATAEISKKYLSRDDARGNDDGWNHGWYDPQKNFLLFFDQIQAKRNSDPAQEDIEKFSEFLGFLNAVIVAARVVTK